MLSQLLNKIITPKSQNEDQKRREFILNILLISTLALLSVSLFFLFYQMLFLPPPEGTEIPAVFVVFISIFFVFLHFLSRKGYSYFSSYVLVGLYFFMATYMVYLWGVEVQAALIFYILVIVLSGVLISTLFSFFVTFLASLVLGIAFYLKEVGLFTPSMAWQEPWDVSEVVVVIIIFGIISTVCWLSNRETEKSLKRARRSEAALKKERDMLEVTVQRRTEELKKVQMEKVAQIYKFAEFGRLSSGFFHDLVNPLTIVSLNMERVKDAQIKEIGEAKTYLAKAIVATKRLEDFIMTARKQVKKQEKKKIFSVSNEVKQIIEMLSYKARKAKVEIKYTFDSKIKIFGDSVKFSQALTNLIANAIDSYANFKTDLSTDQRLVLVNIFEKDKSIFLTIEDFGEGIAEKDFDHIFEPFFTTKEDDGIGIGLSLTHDIIEKNFKGHIEVESKKGKGSKFTVKFL